MTTPTVAQKSPYPIAVESGKTYYWCACGKSSHQPFCNGAHKDSGMAPLPFTAETSKTVYLCGCKHSKTPPFCDGSHNAL